MSAVTIDEPAPSHPTWRRWAVPGAALVILTIVLALLHRELAQIHLRAVLEAWREISPRALGVAAALTLASYFILGLFDVLALRYVGARLGYWRAQLTSFIAFAFGHNLSLAAMTGAAVRFRLYSTAGLSAAGIAPLATFCSLTSGPASQSSPAHRWCSQLPRARRRRHNRTLACWSEVRCSAPSSRTRVGAEPRPRDRSAAVVCVSGHLDRGTAARGDAGPPDRGHGAVDGAGDARRFHVVAGVCSRVSRRSATCPRPRRSNRSAGDAAPPAAARAAAYRVYYLLPPRSRRPRSHRSMTPHARGCGGRATGGVRTDAQSRAVSCSSRVACCCCRARRRKSTRGCARCGTCCRCPCSRSRTSRAA
jgi:hypothetical protein